MEERPESNTELRTADVFTAVNNYFLLFFCGSCMLSSMYLQQLFLYMGHYRLGIGVSSLVAVILPVYLLLRRVGPGFARQVRLSAPRAPQVVYVLLATLATVVIVDQIYLINQQFSPVPQEYIESLKDLRPADGWNFAIIFVGLCVTIPIAEELVFRGMIQQIFSRNMGPVLGFLLTGLVFGAFHLNPHLLISISFFGIFLSFIFYATGNLAHTIISHSLFNVVALLQLTFSGAAESADLPFYLKDVRVFVVSVVLLIFFLYKLKTGGPESEPPAEDQI
ncbi:MAG: CPBP family intramembrane metalloprotease [Candidatus Krumholzibacteria bacterium]|nr:CPBP family intramembrane metalloprotease [Candidatus Krumholzibacteria bacterium]